jgi:heterodisulfide reductase subunit A
MNPTVIIIGGGIAGMEAAASLSQMGIMVTLIEKEKITGGQLNRWDRLFPDRRPAKEVRDYLEGRMNERINLLTGKAVSTITRDNGSFRVELSDGEKIEGEALLFATGFEVFDARRKEEYGYGIYDNVITSADLETLFREKRPLTTTAGNIPKRVGIIHCVGSRDEKAGNRYCSKVCCITGVKQAMEIKELIPGAEVFCFYMDLRMFDRYFEDMYLEAQKKWGIHFIRGRLSEATENMDQSILLKVEDTLTGLPMKISVDILILLIGFVPSEATKKLAEMVGLENGEDGFLVPCDLHVMSNATDVPGVYLSGAVKGPVSIESTINDARSAALQIAGYLHEKRNTDG